MGRNKEGNTIVLALGADENYACPMAVSIYSALVNLNPGWRVELYILDAGITRDSRRKVEHVVNRLEVNVNLKWILFHDKKINSLPVVGSDLNSNTYMRLYLPNLLPSECEKIIYLDCDLIIEKSLSKIWLKDFWLKSVLAVRDYWIPTISHAKGVACYEEIGLNAHAPYFNAGVMVMNLPLWRKENVRDRVLSYVEKYEEHLRFNDQEGLNVVLAGQWKELDLRWNVPYYVDLDRWVHRLNNLPDAAFKERALSRVSDLRRDPGIRHFVTGAKPWKPESHYPSQNRWYAYLWDSGWLTREDKLKSQGSG